MLMEQLRREEYAAIAKLANSCARGNVVQVWRTSDGGYGAAEDTSAPSGADVVAVIDCGVRHSADSVEDAILRA